MRIVTLGIFLLLSGSIASAADKPAAMVPATTMHKGPCYADVERFCHAVPFGNARRIACLEKHMAQLAPACRERVPKLRALFQFGQEQRRRVEAALAKQKAAEAAKASASAGQHTPK